MYKIFPSSKFTSSSSKPDTIMASPRNLIFFILLQIFIQLLTSSAQNQSPPANGLTTEEQACTGVFLRYDYDAEKSREIRPFLRRNETHQPFRFEATASVLNADDVPLQDWSLHIGYPSGTVLVSASNAVIIDGSDFPYIVGQNGSKGVSFSGLPKTGLKTAIETAGDVKQIKAEIDIVGTRFGQTPLLPSNISLDNPEFNCPQAKSPDGRSPTTMFTCCTRKRKLEGNDTSPISDQFLPRRNGDLIISYDVTQSGDTNYLALVRINNTNPLGRLDDWRLTWEWKRGEFIWKTQGGYTTKVDHSDCIFGEQGRIYKGLQSSSIQNCERQPTFFDLPMSMVNDTKLGRIPFCCRNGTILPTAMDQTRSVSAFQLQVYKMPPDLNRSTLFPPRNWKIKGSSGALNPTYACGQPIRVSPAVFPNPRGLPSSNLAIASWQVVCNITRPTEGKPRCCVSFSAYNNDSAVPCKTCACGCNPNVGKKCDATSPALLLPTEALLLPFDNRTKKALAWADINHFNVPNPLPCRDNCGVSINWHLATDYRGGWTARMTLFNWENVDIRDWFAAVVMTDDAYDGFKETYSFDSQAMGNKTMFMKGKQGLNYLLRMNTGVNPMDPGKLQSVMLFEKKRTPGTDDDVRGKFPTKVFFNGEECSVPDVLPSGGGLRGGRPLLLVNLLSFVLAASLLML